MRLLSLGVLFLLAGPVCSQAPARPQGPAPQQRYAVFKDGMIVWEHTATVLKTVDKEVEEKGPDGETVKKVVKTTVAVEEKRLGQVDARQAKLSRADGKLLSAEDVAGLLKEPAWIVLSIDDEPVDPFYLQFLKPETIIVVRPKAEAAKPGA